MMSHYCLREFSFEGNSRLLLAQSAQQPDKAIKTHYSVCAWRIHSHEYKARQGIYNNVAWLSCIADFLCLRPLTTLEELPANAAAGTQPTGKG